MALAKERIGQGCSYYGVGQEVSNASFVGLLGFESYQRMVVDDGNEDENEDFNRLPPLSDQNPETGIMFGDLINSHSEQADQVVINFKAAGAGAGSNTLAQPYGSLLNFQQGESRTHEDCSVWRNAVDHSYGWHNENRLSENVNCYETSSSNAVYHNVKDKQVADEEIGWLYADGGATECGEESASPERNSHNKRPHMGNETESRKKLNVVAGSRKPKAASVVASKDPQSIAAKNRRERISERLKILQDLVPNGSKVDLVTMLEKAISYVKFLQLQVKVLATDEFWPAQGGKAPEVSQVREAIDAILSSQRDGTSSSN